MSVKVRLAAATVLALAVLCPKPGWAYFEVEGSSYDDTIFFGPALDPLAPELYYLVVEERPGQLGPTYVCDAGLLPIGPQMEGVLDVFGLEGDDDIQLLYDEGGDGVADPPPRRVEQPRMSYAQAVQLCQDAGYTWIWDASAILQPSIVLSYPFHTITLSGGDGDDRLYGSSSSEQMLGGYGNDLLVGFGATHDPAYGWGDALWGGEGNDEIRCGWGVLSRFGCQAIGESGDDYILGTDMLDPGTYKEYLSGGTGDDHILGGGGFDYIRGGPDNDLLFGFGDDDYILGEDGDDILSGGVGTHDRVDGGGGSPGNDLWLCRLNDHGDTWHDDGGEEDCIEDGDATYDPVACLDWQVDPHEEWAPYYFTTIHFARMQEGHGSGRTIHSELWTTSGVRPLLTARAGGAQLLMGTPGGIPVSGDFCVGVGCLDPDRSDLAVFVPETGTWRFDLDLDGAAYEPEEAAMEVTGFGEPLDRPFAADLNGDGLDDIGFFRPSEHRVWIKLHDGSGFSNPAVEVDVPTSISSLPLGLDDVDGDGPGLLFFDPWGVDGTSATWMSVTDVLEDPTPFYFSALEGFGEIGDLPLVLDYYGAGETAAVWRPSERRVYIRQSLTSTTEESFIWHLAGRAPSYVVGAELFSHGTAWGDDLLAADPVEGPRIGQGRLFERLASPRLTGDSVTDATVALDSSFFPAGEPVRTPHMQYLQVCGPASLSMVVEHRGLTDRSYHFAVPRDLSLGYPPTEMDMAGLSWNPNQPPFDKLVDLGFRMSMEEIMYEAYAAAYEGDPNSLDDSMLDGCPSCLDNRDWASGGHIYRIDYEIGSHDPPPAPPGPIQTWTFAGQNVDMDSNDHLSKVGPPAIWGCGEGLPRIANLANREYGGRHQDARAIGPHPVHGQVESIGHVAEIVAGFIDHDIPMVAGVTRGGHFNAVVGYWGRPELDGFMMITADPADGWNQDPYSRKRMRWFMFLLNQDIVDGRWLTHLMLFDHSIEGCSGGWASGIDNLHPGHTLLCDYDGAQGVPPCD